MRVISGVYDDNWTGLSVEYDFEGAMGVDLTFYLPVAQDIPTSEEIVVVLEGGKQHTYSLKRGKVSTIGPISHPLPYSNLQTVSVKFDHREVGMKKRFERPRCANGRCVH